MTFNIDESLVLLRAIFPRYPELQEQKPAPDLETFLSSLRIEAAPSDQPALVRRLTQLAIQLPQRVQPLT